jgi:hypothetical protein
MRWIAIFDLLASTRNQQMRHLTLKARARAISV